MRTGKRVMLVGATGCERSALVQALEERASVFRSKQEVVYGEKTIDVPSAYLEHPRMVQSLIAIAQNNASHVVFVVKQGSTFSVGSPGLANVFTCPVVGVVAVTDCRSTDTARSFSELARLGVSKPYFIVDPNDAVDCSLAAHLFGDETGGEYQ